MLQDVTTHIVASRLKKKESMLPIVDEVVTELYTNTGLLGGDETTLKWFRQSFFWII